MIDCRGRGMGWRDARGVGGMCGGRGGRDVWG